MSIRSITSRPHRPIDPNCLRLCHWWKALQSTGSHTCCSVTLTSASCRTSIQNWKCIFACCVQQVQGGDANWIIVHPLWHVRTICTTSLSVHQLHTLKTVFTVSQATQAMRSDFFTLNESNVTCARVNTTGCDYSLICTDIQTSTFKQDKQGCIFLLNLLTLSRLWRQGSAKHHHYNTSMSLSFDILLFWWICSWNASTPG